MTAAAALRSTPAKGVASTDTPVAAPGIILALPAPAASAHPILPAIRAHRRAWALFQVAPDDEVAAAEEAEHEASMRLLGTACASRAGAHALIAHLRWYVAEEGTNLLTSGIGGCERGDLVRARLAELVLFVPEFSPPAVIALPAPMGPSPLLAAIEEHRSANLAMAQAVRDYVEAAASNAPDEAHLLAVADSASEVEAAALNALVALAPASAEETRIITAYFAEVSADLDKDAFGTRLLRRLVIMLAPGNADGLEPEVGPAERRCCSGLRSG
jgi:hypothetical protein